MIVSIPDLCTLTYFCMCSLKHIKGIFILTPGSCPRDGTLGGGGRHCVLGCQFFFEHGYVAYPIDGDDENRMKVKVSPYGQTGDLGVRSKAQISLNFINKSNFKYFYTKL